MDCNRCSPRYLWGKPKMHVEIAVMVIFVTFFRVVVIIIIAVNTFHQ
ncbi:hypothetical protein [Escherichia coli ISC7]|uniref:Uncharacterized protein n=1 Tax=Escherichia coli ISC7 TaxID=1432555 RepID=W1EU68_ECOLX|nr:hypothetical protein [Escherichia coli ISC7]